jgi:hypothetical protein
LLNEISTGDQKAFKIVWNPLIENIIAFSGENFSVNIFDVKSG